MNDVPDIAAAPASIEETLLTGDQIAAIFKIYLLQGILVVYM